MNMPITEDREGILLVKVSKIQNKFLRLLAILVTMPLIVVVATGFVLYYFLESFFGSYWRILESAVRVMRQP